MNNNAGCLSSISFPQGILFSYKNSIFRFFMNPVYISKVNTSYRMSAFGRYDKLNRLSGIYHVLFPLLVAFFRKGFLVNKIPAHKITVPPSYNIFRILLIHQAESNILSLQNRIFFTHIFHNFIDF